MPSYHQIITLEPLYGTSGKHTAQCVCGWTSTPCLTPGQATIAGWEHIHTSPAEITEETK